LFFLWLLVGLTFWKAVIVTFVSYILSRVWFEFIDELWRCFNFWYHVWKREEWEFRIQLLPSLILSLFIFVSYTNDWLL
jgi:hypothetical protein